MVTQHGSGSYHKKQVIAIGKKTGCAVELHSKKNIIYNTPAFCSSAGMLKRSSYAGCLHLITSAPPENRQDAMVVSKIARSYPQHTPFFFLAISCSCYNCFHTPSFNPCRISSYFFRENMKLHISREQKIKKGSPPQWDAVKHNSSVSAASFQ